ncbi:MAG TPA: SGNH/GDSL hydrolase family protein [Acidimicrobiia bacterium]|nr:SGNH/GDSL hydrolase family protein [Acidimicrobiia bacterium]
MRRAGAVFVGAVVALVAIAVPAAAPAPAQAPVSRYVALGDSFTAGPLIPTQLDDPVGCFRSDHNYPHLVATSLHVPSFVDVSCSGATTKDMTSPQSVNPGPDNPPQLDGLDAQTQLVTIGIGGNDIDYSEIIRTCATSDPSGTPCQDHYVHGGDDEISDRIADTAPKIADVLDEIHSRSPGARVFLVNYLSLLPETGSGCFPQVPFADADVPYLRAKEHELNDMLATQAAADDAVLVDAFAAGLGHDACQPPGVRWVEPIATASPAAPGHPNRLGMECTAVAVLAAVAPAAPADPALCAPPAAVVAVPAFTG